MNKTTECCIHAGVLYFLKSLHMYCSSIILQSQHQLLTWSTIVPHYSSIFLSNFLLPLSRYLIIVIKELSTTLTLDLLHIVHS